MCHDFVLKVVKALSRNSVTSTILGRDGVVSLVTNVVTKLARNQFGPRLKVAAEALSNLTKARQNQLLITKGNFVQDLVQAFKNYELYLDRGRMTVKISGALLYIFQHIVGSSKTLFSLLNEAKRCQSENFLQKLESNNS